MIGKIIGNYKILEEIGHGGMGIVYKGVHKTLSDQIVAIKSISPMLFITDTKVKERFLDEAVSLAKLSKHPNIVTLYDFIESEEGLFLVMEFIEGVKSERGMEKTLADRISNQGALPLSEILALFKQVLSGVGFAHKNNIIHRDMKPSNIMLSEFGVKVADFGIARIAAGDTSILLSGQRIGTPPYMSPEQILEKKLDKRTDIYSLGIVLYEMATGELPFKESDTSSILECHIQEEPPHPSKINPAISEELEKIILKALEKKPENRFPNCEEFLGALEKCSGAIYRPKVVAVPSLIGKSKREAEEIISQLKLNLIIKKEEFSENVPFGKILNGSWLLFGEG